MQPSLVLLVVLILALTLALGAANVDAQQPQFPTDWSATETSTVLQNQNTFTDGDAICCRLNGNCQVQVQYAVGKNYIDYTHNRTRYDDASGSTIVTFYDPAIQRECNVVNNTCTEYCPLQGESLTPGFLAANATNIGNTVINGKTYQQWQWKDVILGVVVMDVVTVLIDPSTNPPTPYQQTTLLTPFGQYAGTETTLYAGFTWGTPSAAYFNISGVTTAPQAQNCGSQTLQNHRLAHGLYNTYLYWQQKNMLESFNLQDA